MSIFSSIKNWLAPLLSGDHAGEVPLETPKPRWRSIRELEVSKSPPYVQSWNRYTKHINYDLQASLGVAIARARDLARNNDHARRFLGELKSNVLGPAGLRMQSRMLMRDGIRPNNPVNQAIEKAWLKWGKRRNCEVTLKLSWMECEKILLESLARDGGILVRLLNKRGPLGFQIQLLDYDQLDCKLNKDLANGHKIRMGVELDADNAEVAFWMRNGAKPEFNPYQYTTVFEDHLRIPAEEVIHRFIAEEVNQVRGYPWLAVGGRRLWLIHDYEESAAVAASNAAKRLGFFQSPNGEAPAGIGDQIVSSVLEQAKAAGKVLTAAEVQALVNAAEKYSTTVPGQYDTIPIGYEFKQYQSDYPHTNYSDYVKSCLRGVASGLGISYVTLGNDLESVNYSSARVGILAEREIYRALQRWLTNAVHQDVAAAWLKMALLTDSTLSALNPASYENYLSAISWQPRGWAGIDPNKEAQANQVNLQLKLTSRRRIILERGEDPDEIFQEIADEETLLGPIPDKGTSGSSGEEDAPAGEEEPKASDKPKREMRIVGD